MVIAVCGSLSPLLEQYPNAPGQGWQCQWYLRTLSKSLWGGGTPQTPEMASGELTEKTEYYLTPELWVRPGSEAPPTVAGDRLRNLHPRIDILQSSIPSVPHLRKNLL